MIDFFENDKILDVKDQQFDLLIAVLGFENRSGFISSKLKEQYRQGICFAFQNRQEIAYQKNYEVYESLKFIIMPWQDSIECVELGNVLSEVINKAENDFTSIAIDVSSMTRSMSAKIMYALTNHLNVASDYKITVLYAPAKYSSPKDEQSQMKIAGPVIPEYAGWTLYPELPTYAVLGLGYEYGKALGALDYLDVSETILFRPIGDDEQYVKTINEVNKDLIEMVGKNNVIEYDVSDPYDSFIKMRSLITGLQRHGRIILIPFGPKIFHILCLILAESLQNDISVWRISPGDKENASDSEANGEVISFIFRVLKEK